LALAKQDISGLTQADLLRGDYKEITQPMQVGFRCASSDPHSPSSTQPLAFALSVRHFM
jgi:hypothetical protein